MGSSLWFSLCYLISLLRISFVSEILISIMDSPSLPFRKRPNCEKCDSVFADTKKTARFSKKSPKELKSGRIFEHVRTFLLSLDC